MGGPSSGKDAGLAIVIRSHSRNDRHANQLVPHTGTNGIVARLSRLSRSYGGSFLGVPASSHHYHNYSQVPIDRGASSVGYLPHGSFDERLELGRFAAEQASQRVRVPPEAVPFVVVEHLDECLDLILPHA
jgi:hypothetical protein